MKMPLLGGYRTTIALAVVGLLAIILLFTRPEEIAAHQLAETSAELDTPAEQVRVLTSELMQRDQRLETVERQLRTLQDGGEIAIAIAPLAEPLSAETVLAEAVLADKPPTQTPPPSADSPQWQEVRQMLRDISRQLTPNLTSSADYSAKFGKNGDIIAEIAEIDGYDTPTSAAGQTLVWHGAAFTPAAEKRPDNPSSHLLIPPGTTIGRLRLITSLIGRIPRANQVVSPLPFKALVEASAIAAPGFHLDELRGAVISGEAVGDLLLSCVRGRITGIVLIGEDGQYARTQADEGDSLGYLSDPLGNPCLRGQLVTDYPRALLASGLAKGLEVSAAALAQQQQGTRQNSNGSFDIFNRDSGDFLAGNALSGSAASLGDWIRQRAEDSFDAITVQSGGLAVAHITREISLVQDGKRIGWQPAQQAQVQQSGLQQSGLRQQQ